MRPGGSVVNVTSTMGLIGLAMDAPYAVSKHGVSLHQWVGHFLSLIFEPCFTVVGSVLIGAGVT